MFSLLLSEVVCHRLRRYCNHVCLDPVQVILILNQALTVRFALLQLVLEVHLHELLVAVALG